jgi:hypothetical protein
VPGLAKSCEGGFDDALAIALDLDSDVAQGKVGLEIEATADRWMILSRNEGLQVEPPSAAVPSAVLSVPRRNQGPIVQLDTAAGVAISVQYAGASGTRELDAFRGYKRARDLREFERAMQFFDVASQNFVAADSSGDIAYFMSGEVPLREDLQAGKVSGLPPIFLRNGQGGNEWLPPSGPDPNLSLPFEIFPAKEMPRIFNPPHGFIVAANNDGCRQQPALARLDGRSGRLRTHPAKGAHSESQANSAQTLEVPMPMRFRAKQGELRFHLPRPPQCSFQREQARCCAARDAFAWLAPAHGGHGRARASGAARPA